MPIRDINSPSDFDTLIRDANQGEPCVLFFSAEFAAAECEPIGNALDELARQLPRLFVAKVAAEDNEQLATRFQVDSVPTCIILRQGKAIDRVDGADATELGKKLRQQAAQFIPKAPRKVIESDSSTPADDLNARLKQLINRDRVMLFMKGSPDAPRCGFSRQITAMLSEKSIRFSHFDILQDEQVRQGLKKYSDWPTFPQLYMDGELVGGLDIVREMIQSGELKAPSS